MKDAPRGPILIAEDNVTAQQVAKRLVARLGYQVDVVPSGLQALDAMSRTHYSLVLMDCQMPRMNGYEAAAEIRKREGASRHTPIIAMTAGSAPGELENCMTAGMDDYIEKPVQLRELAAALERWTPPASGPLEGSNAA